MSVRKILNVIIVGNSILNFCYLYLCYTTIDYFILKDHGDKQILSTIYGIFILLILFPSIYLFFQVSIKVNNESDNKLFIYQLTASLITLIFVVLFMFVIISEKGLSSFSVYASLITFIVISFLFYSIISLKFTLNKRPEDTNLLK